MIDMDKILQTIAIVLTLVCGVVILRLLIGVLTKVLYQILVHPQRTLMMLIGVGVIYGLYTMIDRYTRKI
jgi:cytochrome b subunit of formate dehydrogenase